MTRTHLPYLLTAFMAMGTPSSAVAQTDCAAEGSAHERARCLGAQRAELDTLLSSLESELQEALDPGVWTELARIQASWEAFRAGDCRLEASAFDDDLSAAVRDRCLAVHSAARIRRLGPWLCAFGMNGECPRSQGYLERVRRILGQTADARDLRPSGPLRSPTPAPSTEPGAPRGRDR